MPSGLSWRADFVEQARSWEQFWIDTATNYPMRMTWACLAVALVIILGAWWTYHSTQNHRLLVGAELARGHDAFTAIKTAEDTAEDFANPAARRKAFSEAQTKISDYQQYARTEEELHAGSILSFYLDEVKQLPDRDRDCSKAMQTAQQIGMANATVAAGGDPLVIAEVGELTCLSGRSQAIAIKNLCRDEALSYLIPNRQPPVDACMFRHMAQTDSSR